MSNGKSGYMTAMLLDGKGGARELSDAEVDSWTPTDGLLWVVKAQLSYPHSVENHIYPIRAKILRKLTSGNYFCIIEIEKVIIYPYKSILFLFGFILAH